MGMPVLLKNKGPNPIFVGVAAMVLTWVIFDIEWKLIVAWGVPILVLAVTVWPKEKVDNTPSDEKRY